jgi:membrane protein
VALIPLALLGIALLGAFGQQHVWDSTLGPPIEHRVLPQVWLGVNATVQRIFQNGSGLLIPFALVLSVWDMSSAVRACGSGLNEVRGTRDRRPTWLRFAVSIGLAVAVLVCLVGAALLLTAGARVAHDVGGAAGYGISIVRWVVAVTLLGLAVGLIVRFAPYEPPSPKWVSAGAVLIVVTWLVTSLVFRWFVTSVANYRSGPGGLLAFALATTYVYTSSIIFMVGIQLDALIRSDR